MKLKSIIALALAALMASCTLNSKLKKLEKACDEKEVDEVIKILKDIKEKYNEPKDWNFEQAGRLECAIDELKEDLRDDDKYKDELEEIDEIYDELGEKVADWDC